MIRAGWYGILWYALTLAFTKISICMLYFTIFTYEWSRRACWILIAIVIISNLWVVSSVLTACIPLQAFWDISIKGAYCHPQSVWWANTGLNMATDYLIFILPIPVIWSLNLPQRQKMLLVGVFALGFFVCFISVLRLINLIQTETNPALDFTYAGAALTYWTTVEVDLAIVCSCIMTLKPLVRRFYPRLLDSRYGISQRRPSEPNSLGLPPPAAAAGRPGVTSPGFGENGRPLTVGSRPSRNQLRGGVHGRGESWIDFPGKIGDGLPLRPPNYIDVSMREFDIEANASPRSRHIEINVDPLSKETGVFAADWRLPPSNNRRTDAFFSTTTTTDSKSSASSSPSPIRSATRPTSPHRRQPSSAELAMKQLAPLPPLPPSQPAPARVKTPKSPADTFYDSSSSRAASGLDLLDIGDETPGGLDPPRGGRLGRR